MRIHLTEQHGALLGTHSKMQNFLQVRHSTVYQCSCWSVCMISSSPPAHMAMPKCLPAKTVPKISEIAAAIAETPKDQAMPPAVPQSTLLPRHIAATIHHPITLQLGQSHQMPNAEYCSAT